MKYTESPILAMLFPKARRELLTFFMLHDEGEFYVRDIARRTSLPIQAVQRELSGFEQIGLISSNRQGRQKFFSVNRAHPVFPELHALVIKTSGIVEPLREALEGLEGVQIAFVFGSFADGSATALSDVDLLVVGEVGPRAVSSVLSGGAQRLGREIHPVVMAPEEFKKRKRQGEHFLATILHAPKLLVVGSADDLESKGRGAVGEEKPP